MKTLELEPSLEGTKLTFDLPADVAAAIAAHPGRKLQLNVPDDEPAVPVPAPGDGPEAWAHWHRSLGTLSEDFEWILRQRQWLSFGAMSSPPQKNRILIR